MLDRLNSGQQQFRSFCLQLIADNDRRREYFAERHEQEYGREFVVRTKELMSRFVSALNSLLPHCAIDRVILSLLVTNVGQLYLYDSCKLPFHCKW